MSDRRHRSGHQRQSAERSSRGSGSSGGQPYVLPAATYAPTPTRAGSGGQPYVLPAATYAPTPTRAGSGGQPYVLPAATYAPTPGSAGSGGGHDSGSSQHASSTGTSARERLYDQYGRDHASTPSGTGSHELVIGYDPSGNAGAQQGGQGVPGEGSSRPHDQVNSTARAYAMQREIDAQPPITYGPESKSGGKARDLKRNPITRFVKRSADKAKDKLRRKK